MRLFNSGFFYVLGILWWNIYANQKSASLYVLLRMSAVRSYRFSKVFYTWFHLDSKLRYHFECLKSGLVVWFGHHFCGGSDNTRNFEHPHKEFKQTQHTHASVECNDSSWRKDRAPKKLWSKVQLLRNHPCPSPKFASCSDGVTLIVLVSLLAVSGITCTSTSATLFSTCSLHWVK